jgi:hypothetical protein
MFLGEALPACYILEKGPRHPFPLGSATSAAYACVFDKVSTFILQILRDKFVMLHTFLELEDIFHS